MVGNDSHPRHRAAWPLALVAVAGLVLLGWWMFLRAIPEVPDLDDAGRTAAAVARAFRQGTLTTEFTSYASSIEGTQRLQVASLDTVERISRRDQASVLWGQLELPAVVVEASLPVTYSYYLDLDKPWNLHWNEATHELTVQTPPLEWTRPAVDVSGMRFEASATHPLRDEQAALDRLQSAISPWLEEQAEQHRNLVESTAREEVENWVRSWVQSEYGQVGEIVVVLGEAPPYAPASSERPQL